MKSDSPRTISIDWSTLLKIGVLALFAFWFWQIYDILIVIITAVVIAAFVEQFVVFLGRFKVPRFVSVILFFIIAFLVLGGVLYLFVPVLISEIGVIGEAYPELLTSANVPEVLGSLTRYGSDLTGIIKAFSESFAYEDALHGISVLFGGALNFFLLIAISVYLSLIKGGIDNFLRLVIPDQYEKYAIGLWRRVQIKIGGWFRGQLFIAFLVFLLTSFGLLVVGIPYALLLGIVAGLFSLFPYGIAVALIPTVFIGFATNGWPGGILVILIYAIIQIILDYLIQPLVVRRVAGVPPLLVIISLIIGARLFGFLGLIIGIPFTVFILEAISDYEESRGLKQPEAIE